jgi:hypothetical protein
MSKGNLFRRRYCKFTIDYLQRDKRFCIDTALLVKRTKGSDTGEVMVAIPESAS